MRAKELRNRKVLKLHEQGFKHGQIAELFGISRPRVSKILATFGVSSTRGRPVMMKLSTADAALYRKVRGSYGAAYAREIMGIAA